HVGHAADHVDVHGVALTREIGVPDETQVPGLRDVRARHRALPSARRVSTDTMSACFAGSEISPAASTSDSVTGTCAHAESTTTALAKPSTSRSDSSASRLARFEALIHATGFSEIDRG